ncbi:hypothetical protein AVEN_62706-1 [Araneus ventricosus]|uniref:Uncharacterized protein n=1 Tax=Araneus ventricosus TaxID=182803 RepID=A0A4Y2FLH2_ARAVE|nr:hypothetical protein AVEN_62706-1 [Araneus ventricosus]
MTAAAIASSTEAGVLVDNHLAMARPLPKEERTITCGRAQSPTTTIPTGEASSCLLIQKRLISVYLQCPYHGSSGQNKTSKWATSGFAGLSLPTIALNTFLIYIKKAIKDFYQYIY